MLQLKFVFVAPRFHINQTAVVKSLIDYGCKVEFHVFSIGASEDYDVLKPTLIRLSPLSRILRHFFGTTGYRRMVLLSFPLFFSYYCRLRKADPDVVVVREPENSTFALIAAICTRLQRRRLVVYRQVEITHYFDSWRLRIFRRLCNAVWITPVRYPGTGTHWPVCRQVAGAPVFYIPLPVLPVLQKNIQPKKDSGEKPAFRILDVGKFQRRKNHLMLIRALLRLRHQFALHLTIVGEKDERLAEHSEVAAEINTMIVRNQAEKLVSVKTNLPHREVLAEFAACDLFILPSSCEPASFSQLEAMACGRPVICSDDNGTAGYVQSGVNGFIFAADREDDLVSKIAELLKFPERLPEMGRKSLELAQSVHSPDSYRKALLGACGYH